MKKEWTEKEINYLIENAGKISGDEIAEYLGRTKYSLWNKSRRLGISLEITYGNIKPGFFQEWNEHSAYILGYIFADGNITDPKDRWDKRIQVVSCDFEILYKMKKIMEYKNKIYPNKPGKRNKEISYHLVISGKDNYNRMLELGLEPRKSFTGCRFPKEIPNNVLNHFIRGYFDGDGSIKSRKYPHITFTGYKLFLKDLTKKLPGIDYLIYDKVGCSDLHYQGDRALEILDFMYKDASIYMERKYSRYLKIRR